jgi:hypothetical protein
LFSTDVTQAYLRSAEKVLRDVYIKPMKEFSMGPGQLLKLLRPPYGLADSGDYWWRTLSNHLRKNLGMESTTGVPALFFKSIEETLSGLCATYVDDTLQAGDKRFVELSELKQRRFQCRPRE